MTRDGWSSAQLPFGTYQSAGDARRIRRLSPASLTFSSATPMPYTVTLGLASLQSQVSVTADDTLVDSRQTASVNRIGRETHRVPRAGAARTLGPEPYQHAAGVAPGGQRRPPSAGFRISDAVRRRRPPPDGQPLALIRTGNRGGFSALDGHSHRRLPGGVRPEARRHHRSCHGGGCHPWISGNGERGRRKFWYARGGCHRTIRVAGHHDRGYRCLVRHRSLSGSARRREFLESWHHRGLLGPA